MPSEKGGCKTRRRIGSAAVRCRPNAKTPPPPQKCYKIPLFAANAV
ncbi:hypothetical protein [Neisseria lactamica]|nr:hypothetical protein [Neisseria lactamica]